MMFNEGVISQIELEVVAHPKEGDTVQDLIVKLEAAGHEIKEVYSDSVLILSKIEELI